MKLIEREQQIHELTNAWNQVISGRGRIALISGEAGIGKTSLIERFISEQGKSASVLWGSCDALFSPQPLGPFIEITIQMESNRGQSDLYRLIQSGTDRLSFSVAQLSPQAKALVDLASLMPGAAENWLIQEIPHPNASILDEYATEDSDLFWAVRGGGGNFGVVTSFLFQGQPVGQTVYGGPIFWELEHAPKVMRFWRDLILTGPEEINGWLGFHTVPPVEMFPAKHHLKKMVAVTWCCTGDLQQAEQVFRSIRAVAPPAIDFAGPIPFPALQGLFDGLYPPGLQWYWNADFVTDLSDQAIDLHIRYARQLPSVHSTMHLYPINGAAHRVEKNDTDFSYREANFGQVIVGVDPDPANNSRVIAWSKEYWRAMYPFSSGGGYVNMMMDEGQDRVQAAYHDNYPRLAQIKAKYDPENLFRVNQNIKPAREERNSHVQPIR